MPRKAKPSQLTPDLLLRFDMLLWTHTEASAREWGLPYEKLSAADYAEQYDTRRRNSHAILSALDRRGTDLEKVLWILFTARTRELVLRRGWVETGRARALEAERTTLLLPWFPVALRLRVKAKATVERKYLTDMFAELVEKDLAAVEEIPGTRSKRGKVS